MKARKPDPLPKIRIQLGPADLRDIAGGKDRDAKKADLRQKPSQDAQPPSRGPSVDPLNPRQG